MSIEENKAIVGRWFTEFWGKDFNPAVIDELAAPDIRFEYSLHAPCRGRDEVRAFATAFRAAFPDLNFWGTADLLAEGDYVVGQWEGGGTHTGPAFDDMPIGRPARQHRQDDALHRHHHPQGRERPDHRGGRSGRRRHRASAARPDPRQVAGRGWCLHQQHPVRSAEELDRFGQAVESWTHALPIQVRARVTSLRALPNRRRRRATPRCRARRADAEGGANLRNTYPSLARKGPKDEFP